MGRNQKPLSECAIKATVTVERALADRAREIAIARAQTQEACIAATWRALDACGLAGATRTRFATLLRKELDAK